MTQITRIDPSGHFNQQVLKETSLPTQSAAPPMQYSYFPGCSLHSTGLEYGLSTQAVFRHLDMQLTELKDWNCCGASSAHALNHTLALALPARLISLAQTQERDLVIPCAACFNRLKNTDHILRSDPQTRRKIESIVGFQYSGTIALRPVLAVLFEDCGLERIAQAVKRPLSQLKVVTYYGCLLLRPPLITQFDDPDDPKVMAALLRATGASVVPWSYASDCCGGSLSLSRSDLVESLVDRLAQRAKEAQADAIVTACPLCQVNLEMRQTTSPKVPIFYFTELLGLAFDLPESRQWWSKHLIDPRPLLRQAKLLS